MPIFSWKEQVSGKGVENIKVYAQSPCFAP